MGSAIWMEVVGHVKPYSVPSSFSLLASKGTAKKTYFAPLPTVNSMWLAFRVSSSSMDRSM